MERVNQANEIWPPLGRACRISATVRTPNGYILGIRWALRGENRACEPQRLYSFLFFHCRNTCLQLEIFKCGFLLHEYVVKLAKFCERRPLIPST